MDTLADAPSAKRETYRRNANEFKTPSDEAAARCGIFAEQKERTGILALVDLLGCGRPAKTRQRPARRMPEAGDGEILGCCCSSSSTGEPDAYSEVRLGGRFCASVETHLERLSQSLAGYRQVIARPARLAAN